MTGASHDSPSKWRIRHVKVCVGPTSIVNVTISTIAGASVNCRARVSNCNIKCVWGGGGAGGWGGGGGWHLRET